MSWSAVSVALVILLCGVVPSQGQPPRAKLSTATACPSSASDFAKSSMISASFDAAKGTMTIAYTGCPRHNWSTQTTPNTAAYSCASTTVKWPPTIQPISKAKTIGIYASKTGSGAKNPSPLMGPIGVTLDAVVLFGNGDADMRDAYVFEGATFDTTCGGHASPTGEFHYHSEPKSGCVAAAVAGQHSPLLGIMVDGVPLYASHAFHFTVCNTFCACTAPWAMAALSRTTWTNATVTETPPTRFITITLQPTWLTHTS